MLTDAPLNIIVVLGIWLTIATYVVRSTRYVRRFNRPRYDRIIVILLSLITWYVGLLTAAIRDDGPWVQGLFALLILGDLIEFCRQTWITYVIRDYDGECDHGDDEKCEDDDFVDLEPADLARIILQSSESRDIELHHALEHERQGHEQWWRRSSGISLRDGYYLIIACSCQAEFIVASVNTESVNEKGF